MSNVCLKNSVFPSPMDCAIKVAMMPLVSLTPPLAKPTLGGYMTVEHDGTAAFNRGIFESYEGALSNVCRRGKPSVR